MATVLVVDDSASMRQMVSTIVTSAGHDVSEAVNGEDALSQAHGKKFDLVITDLNMPLLDGIALTRALRAMPNYQYIPILLLTTENTAEIKKLGKSAGATGWLVKPFNPQQLLTTIRRALGVVAC